VQAVGVDRGVPKPAVPKRAMGQAEPVAAIRVRHWRLRFSAEFNAEETVSAPVSNNLRLHWEFL